MNFGGKAKATSALIGEGNEVTGGLSSLRRGRDRGKGRDGGGEYEMVGMKEFEDGNV